MNLHMARIPLCRAYWSIGGISWLALSPVQLCSLFSIEDKNVVLIDDVFFTGRTVRSGLEAMLAFGRPAKVELLVLVDRRYSRHLPIQPNYRGRQVDAINKEKVIVSWKENDGEDVVYLVNR